MANELDANIIIEIENHSAGAAKGVELLATSVTNLKNASSGFKGLTTVATSIAKINQAANGINPESFAKLQTVISSLGTALAPLQSIQKSNLGSVFNQLKKLPEVMSGLNTAFANEAQVKAFGDNILRLTDLLRPLATEMQKVSNGFSALPTKLQRAMYSLEKTNSVAARTSTTFSKLGRYLTAGGLYYGLMRLGNVFSKFITESNAYVENVNLFRVSMGDASDEAVDFANSLGELLGIDPSQFIRYQGVFKQIGNSFGIVNEQATIMSRNLTMLAYDYSSLFNTDVEVAAEKFQSAIVGMARPLRAFGIDIQESEIAVTALNLGLDVNVRSLSQADKAILRYITIYQKSNSVMGDMTRTISSTANQVRILKAQTTQFVRAMGNLLIPIFSKVLPYIIAFVNVLTAAINRMATFFGFEMPKFDYSDLEAGGELFDDIADSADNASAAIKNATMGFDELNVISESSGTGIGDLGGSLLSGIDLSKYDYTERFLGNVQSAVDKLKPQMEALLNVLSLVLGGYLLLKGYGLFTKIGSALGLGTGTMVATSGVPLGVSFGKSILLGIGKALPLIVAGTAGLLGNLAMNKDIAKNGELTGKGFISGLVGFLGTAGFGILAGLSAPLSLGIAAGIGGVSLATGYLSSDGIGKLDVFAGEWDKTSQKLQSISQTTKESVEPFLSAMKDLDVALDGLDWSDRIVTDEDVANISTRLGQVNSLIVSKLDNDLREQLQGIEPLRETLGEEAFNDLSISIQENYENIKLDYQKGLDEINLIMQTASEENRKITDEEAKIINNIQKKMTENGVKYLSDSEAESLLILRNLKKGATQLSLETAKSLIENSKLAKEEAILNAQDQYDEVMIQAEKMLAIGTINQEQYDLIAKSAEDAKDDAIKSAKEQFENILKEAQKQLPEITKYMDTETGEMKSNWDRFWDDLFNKASGSMAGVGSSYNNLLSILNKPISLPNVQTYTPKTGSSGGGAKLNLPGFANGGLIYDTTMAMVGEYSNSRTNPEVIAPLSDLQAILSNTNTNSGMSAEEIALLREQNDLLRRIADKDTTLEINGREIARAVNKSTKEMGYNVGFTTV